MHHFFVDPSAIRGDLVFLRGEDAHHLRDVLRARPGEEVLISDGSGADFLCEVADQADDRYGMAAEVSGEEAHGHGHGQGQQGGQGTRTQEVLLRVRFREAPHELPVDIYLFQAIPKADRMELVVQKAVELGARAIVPLETRHVVVRLEGSRREGKRKRWQAIAEAAAKQSKRSLVPEVLPVTDWKDALDMFADFALCLFPYEKAEDMGASTEALRTFQRIIRQHGNGDEDGRKGGNEGRNEDGSERRNEDGDGNENDNGSRGKGGSGSPVPPAQIRPKVALLIGPEGGFSPEEAQEALAHSFLPMTLGKRILRTETAAICALSLLMFAAESAWQDLSCQMPESSL